MLDLRLILVSVLWGMNFSLVKYALTDFYPLSFTIVRFSLASLFLFVILLVNRDSFAVAPRDCMPIIRLGLIGITLYNILFMYGLKHTTASNSALFIATSPLFTAIIQTAVKKERISMTGRIGFLLSSFGVVIIIRHRLGAFSTTWQNLAGDLLTLAAAFSWALYTISARPLLEKHSPIKITAWTMAAGTLALLPFGLPELVSQQWDTISVQSWAALGFGAFFAGGISYALWYQGVKRIGATRTSAYHYLMPFSAVLFAALFLGEKITSGQILGGIAILSGVALVQKSLNVYTPPHRAD